MVVVVVVLSRGLRRSRVHDLGDGVGLILRRSRVHDLGDGVGLILRRIRWTIRVRPGRRCENTIKTLI